MSRKRILSGVQPTGNLHIGNYFGAIRNWVLNQANYENFFCVVDLHAITVPHDPQQLAQHTRQVAALYIACGIDPQLSTIFVQSHVPAHAELAWLFNCITPLNWLERMIQFKEKALKQGENVGVGLLDYPVLMAADILLYRAELVPVGEDQKQHLELTRDIAQRFNYLFARDSEPILPVPEPLISDKGARIMSLTDGTSKMSKSDPQEMSRINILDSPDAIAKKIKRCKTDMGRSIELDNPERPECQNLVTIYGLATGKSAEELRAECANFKGWSDFKPALTEALIEHLRPIQQKYTEVMGERGYLDQVLAEGRAKASVIASETLTQVKSAMGFLL
jgi:tryptophanyl-tRNA synthetase